MISRKRKIYLNNLKFGLIGFGSALVLFLSTAFVSPDSIFGINNYMFQLISLVGLGTLIFYYLKYTSCPKCNAFLGLKIQKNKCQSCNKEQNQHE